MEERLNEIWASGAAYEPYVGRWSRLVARQFVHWLAVPPASRWLDIGCGTGALSQTLLRLASPMLVTGVDPSEEYIAFVREQLVDERAHFIVGNAQALPLETASYDAVVSGLVLNFVPRPGEAAREMARVARQGAIAAAYLWDYAEGMELMRAFWDAAGALDPAALDLDEGGRFPLCRPEPLGALFRDAGFQDIAVHAIEIPTTFRDFDDYWSPFLGGQGPAPGYAMSLDEGRRTALRERIRAGLPIAPDGSIALTARAWAVRGIRA